MEWCRSSACRNDYILNESRKEGMYVSMNAKI